MSDWNFDTWVKKFKLSSTAIGVLKSEELNTFDTLMGITEGDIMVLKLPAGQRVAVRQAINTLKLTQCGGSGAKPVTTKDLQVNSNVDDLAKLLAESGGLLGDVAGGPIPEGDSTQGCAGGKKPLLIPDFSINSKVTPETADEEYLNMTNSSKLVFRSGRSKKPEDINMCQWTAANAAICLTLMTMGELSSLNDVRGYMTHTRNIGEMAQVNTVASVMQYD
jgi:hypothetical protein